VQSDERACHQQQENEACARPDRALPGQQQKRSAEQQGFPDKEALQRATVAGRYQAQGEEEGA
jgi:hypothetical protein